MCQHVAKYYQVFKKFQELELEKETFQRVSTLLIETSKSEAWSEDSSDDQNPKIDELDTPFTSDTDKSKHLNMLNKEHHLILDIV